MSWKKVKLESILKQYRIEHYIDNDTNYRQITISKHSGVTIRGGYKKGKDIGRKRQFIIDLNKYPNTLLFVRQGVYDGAIGIAPSNVDGCIATENMPMFSIKNIDIRYFDYLINSDYFKNKIKSIKTTGSAQKSVHEKILLKMNIEIPSSIKKQKELIVCLEGINKIYTSILAEQSYQLDLIKKLRQQILKDAIQGKLVPQNPEDEPASELLKKIKTEKERLIKEKKIKKEKPLAPISEDELPFAIPENWKWCRLGEFCYIASGSTPKQDAFVDEGIPYLKMYNIRGQKIDFEHRPQYIKKEIHEGLLKRSRTLVGDVLMNIVGPPLGKVAIIPAKLIEANFNQAAVLIRPLLFKEAGLNYWIYWHLNEMSEINSISTKGVAGQDNISMTQAKNIKIPLPPLGEQQRIVERVDELMDLCNKLEESIIRNQEITERLYQSALKEALQPKETKKITLLSNYCDVPKRTILAGYILNQCHTEDFGRVKFMKLLYLVEHICYLDFNSQYIKKAAGPYDENLIKEIEQKLSQMQFYQIQQDKKDNKRVHYTRLECADELDSLFAANYANEKEAVDGLLAKFKKSKWDQCEIIATLYAVWNNRIIQHGLINNALLKQDFLDWDKNKAKYKDRLDAALDWMRNNGIVPNGYGKLIEKP